ncbi:MAG: right-handed parallel beta-helix repeat-containing protein, partial [Candidatus Eisenbacteria bacterium]|nr:right-handed parallel beta-helix repeat-containing protein [Candidatus Eisenbacteria bacterium]
MRATFTILVLVAITAVLSGAAHAATVDVSQPVQVTSGSYYERGQAVVYDGTDYWLFYGRSASCNTPYSGATNPDVHDYAIYYKKASSVAGLASASAVAVPGATDCYLGETGAAVVDGNVWTFGAVPSVGFPGAKSLYGWYTGDGGTSWTQVADLWDDMPDGAAHHDEIGFDGKLYVMANYPESYTGWYSKWTDDPTAGTITWSSPIPLDATSNLINGTGHFYAEGSSLYIGILRTYPTKDNKVLQYVASPEAWTELCTASSSGWDGALLKVGSDYLYAQAPWEDPDRQYIIGWSGSSPSTVLGGSSHMIAEGRYGSNSWVDMWPIGFTDAGGTSYLFYTSERDVPSAEGVGNIWYLEFDWDPAGDHFTYIKEAVAASASGDLIAVSAGTYNERLNIGKALTIRGAQYGVDPTLGGRTNPAAESVIDITGLSVANPNIAVELSGGASGTSFSGFTVIGSPTFHYADEAVFRAWCGDLTIEDNIIDGYIAVLHKGGSNADISRNLMTVNKGAITLQPGTYSAFTVAGNAASLGTSPAGDAAAMYMTGATDVDVIGNDFSGFPGGNGIGGSGITNVLISGNDLSDCRKGVNIWGNTTFIDVTDNDITGCSNAGVNIKGQDITVTGNDFTGCDVGFEVGRHVIDTERVTASDNNFSGCTTFGLKVDTVNVTETVDASGNYWGSTDTATVRGAANAGDGV